MKLNVEKDGSGLFNCPGCEETHVVRLAPQKQPWTFNGDIEKPTISPSILVKKTFGHTDEKMVCHSFIKDGMIQFLNDCTHALAGKTVPLPDYDGIKIRGYK